MEVSLLPAETLVLLLVACRSGAALDVDAAVDVGGSGDGSRKGLFVVDRAE